MKICKLKSVFLQILHQSSVLSNITSQYLFSLNIIYFGQKEPINLQIFEAIECSGQNLSNSSCQFWDDKPIPVQISSVSWKITLLHLSSSNNINVAEKEPIKAKILETFECWGQNLSSFSCRFWNDKPIVLQTLHHSYCRDSNSSEYFKLTHFLLWIKESHQCSNFETLVILVKICHIPHVIFQTTSQFFFKFCITLQCQERYLLCTFLRQTLCPLHRNQSKWKFWEFQVFISKFTTFLSFLKYQISFSSNFALLFSVMRHYSSILFFSWNFIYFQQKEPLAKFHVSSRMSDNLHFDGLLLLSKSYNVSAKKVEKMKYLSCHWRVIQSFKKDWLLVSNMTRIWWIFTQPIKSLKISFRWALFVQSIKGLNYKNTGRFSFMTLNSDAKFE